MKIILPIMMMAMIYYGSAEYHHRTWGKIGIEFCPINHKIIKVWQHSPAQDAHLVPGDIVKHINSADIDGPIGTYVNLTIQRGNQVLTFVIERVPINTIDWKHEAIPGITTYSGKPANTH